MGLGRRPSPPAAPRPFSSLLAPAYFLYDLAGLVDDGRYFLI